MTTFQKIVALINTMTAQEMEELATRVSDMSGDLGKRFNEEQMRQTLTAIGRRYSK